MKQANISFNKGIHRTPSIGSDGELSECVNLIPVNGELVNVPMATPIHGLDDAGIGYLPNKAKLVAVHEVVKDGVKVRNYIYFVQDTSNPNRYRIGFRSEGSTSNTTLSYSFPSSTLSCAEPIGNSLYIYAGQKRSLLWNGTTYIDYSSIPKADVSFGLFGQQADRANGSFSLNDYDHWAGSIEDGDVERVTTAVLGCVNRVYEKNREDGFFTENFMVRTAVELYDGSLVNLSSPVYMHLDNRTGVRCAIKREDGSTMARQNFTIQTQAIKAKLMWKRLDTSSFSAWSDIIRSVNIYVSSPIHQYDQSGKITNIVPSSHTRTFYGAWHSVNNPYNTRVLSVTDLFDSGYTEFDLPTVQRADYTASIENCSEFYLLERIPISSYTSGSNRREVNVPSGYLNSLTTHERLADSPIGRDTIVAENAKAYNSRLNLFNASIELFKGSRIDACVPYTEDSAGAPGSTYRTFVYIEQGGATFILETPDKGALSGSFPFFYYFFPNPNAYKLVISNGNKRAEISLKPHNFLHGAFAYSSTPFTWTSSTSIPTEQGSGIVSAKDRVYYSGVSNPWYIQSFNTLPVNEIYEIETTAKALSQGQFGQFPLYAFCDNGIWALEVSGTGSISSRQPVSRDVLSVKSSVTQLDNAIAFISREGIKILSGSNTELISAPIHGYNLDESFAEDFIDEVMGEGYVRDIRETDPFNMMVQNEGTKMLYDYTNQFIRVFLPNFNLHYVYDRRSGEWTRASNISPCETNIVPSYPISIFQAFAPKVEQGEFIKDEQGNYESTGESAIGSFDVQQFTRSWARGIVITKPYSFNDPFARKALHDLRLFGQRTYDTTKNRRLVAVYVSNDQEHWDRLNSLKALSAKFYRFVILTYMNSEETLSGMSLMYEERFSHKLR